MTKDQANAVAEAKKILDRHFDSYVIAYRVTDENLRTSVFYSWYGGVPDVIGLLEIAKVKMLNYATGFGPSGNPGDDQERVK